MGDLVGIVEEDNSVSLYPQGPGNRVADAGRQTTVRAIQSIGKDRLLFWGGSKIQQYRWVADPGPALTQRLSRPLSREEWAYYLGSETWRDTREAYRNHGSHWLQWIWPH
jgi:hypothetical protein